MNNKLSGLRTLMGHRIGIQLSLIVRVPPIARFFMQCYGLLRNGFNMTKIAAMRLVEPAALSH